MRIIAIIICSGFIVGFAAVTEKGNDGHGVKDKLHNEKVNHRQSHYERLHHGHQEKHHHEKHLHEKSHQHHGAHYHEKSHQIHHHVQHSRHHRPKYSFRDENVRNGSTSLEILYKRNAGLIGIVKKPQNDSIIIDAPSNLAALLDGQNGTLFLIDFNSSSVYKVQYNPNTRNAVWLASSNSFEAYFSNLPSLQAVLQIALQYGTKSSLKSLSQSDDQQIQNILSGLGFEGSLQDVLKLLNSFIAKLKGRLNTLYQNNGVFYTPNNIEWYLQLNLGIGYLLDISGNEQGTQPYHIDLNFIFSATSGLEALIRLLGQIGERVDLTRAFQNLFTDPNQALKLLGEISGGSHNGLDGIITIILNIVNFFQGNRSLSDIFNSITNFNASTPSDTNVTAIEDEFLQLVESQNRLFNNSAQFHTFITVIRQLARNNYFFNHINLSQIIKLLTDNSPTGRLNAIIEIVRNIAPSPINQFFSYILGLFNSTQGVGGIQRLFPGLNLGNITGSGNILQNILQRFDIRQLLSNSGNDPSALSQIPVIGPIISRIASAFGQGFEHFFNISSIASTFEHAVTGIFGGANNSSGPGSIAEGIANAAHNIGNAIGSIFGIGGSNPGSGSTLPSGENGSGGPTPDKTGDSGTGSVTAGTEPGAAIPGNLGSGSGSGTLGSGVTGAGSGSTSSSGSGVGGNVGWNSGSNIGLGGNSGSGTTGGPGSNGGSGSGSNSGSVGGSGVSKGLGSGGVSTQVSTGGASSSVDTGSSGSGISNAGPGTGLSTTGGFGPGSDPGWGSSTNSGGDSGSGNGSGSAGGSGSGTSSSSSGGNSILGGGGSSGIGDSGSVGGSGSGTSSSGTGGTSILGGGDSSGGSDSGSGGGSGSRASSSGSFQ